MCLCVCASVCVCVHAVLVSERCRSVWCRGCRRDPSPPPLPLPPPALSKAAGRRFCTTAPPPMSRRAAARGGTAGSATAEDASDPQLQLLVDEALVPTNNIARAAIVTRETNEVLAGTKRFKVRQRERGAGEGHRRKRKGGESNRERKNETVSLRLPQAEPLPSPCIRRRAVVHAAHWDAAACRRCGKGARKGDGRGWRLAWLLLLVANHVRTPTLVELKLGEERRREREGKRTREKARSERSRMARVVQGLAPAAPEPWRPQRPPPRCPAVQGRARGADEAPGRAGLGAAAEHQGRQPVVPLRARRQPERLRLGGTASL